MTTELKLLLDRSERLVEKVEKLLDLKLGDEDFPLCLVQVNHCSHELAEAVQAIRKEKES